MYIHMIIVTHVTIYLILDVSRETFYIFIALLTMSLICYVYKPYFYKGQFYDVFLIHTIHSFIHIKYEYWLIPVQFSLKRTGRRKY